jgi:hypothetical protein
MVGRVVSTNTFAVMVATMILQINMQNKSLGLHHEPSHLKHVSMTLRKKPIKVRMAIIVIHELQ